jgi:hypothetical protein
MKIRKFLKFSPRNDVCVYKEKFINVRRAPEPNDILWENLDVTKATKMKIRFKINLITVICLLLGLGFLFGFRLLQSFIEVIIFNPISKMYI